MKKFGVITAFIALFFSLVQAQQPVESVESLFQQANNAYRNGDYNQAVELYSDVMELGYESAALYYNLGNACYKMDQLGEARLYYEKARQLAPADEAIQHNLTLLERRLVDQIEAAPQLFIVEWWRAFVSWLGIPVLKLLVQLFLLALLLSLAVYIYRRRRGQKGWQRMLVICSLLWLFSVVLFVNKMYFVQSENYAVVMEPKLNAYAGPLNNSTQLFVLHEGTRLQVLRSTDGWLEIRLADGKTGWIRATTVQFI